ncbi:MAG: tRNA glutamyl-Q(34) synthetase GluQRS [Gammaproteobacteria bacterium]|nr:tRNA glutamyl-Q(34) synthetase GluQRS [Gammaproteobacteria bacterium]
MPASPSQTGRFAPSPTGPLHFGSLIAALGSYAQARSTGARWLVRIDDIDPPREMPGASDAILRTLEAFGFEWDGLLRQSERSERYIHALDQLEQAQRVYGCTCSRKQIAATATRSAAGWVYPGTCRGMPTAPSFAHRVVADGNPLLFVDRVRGTQTHILSEETGDFIVRRRGGWFAYHLACAVDDADGIGEVVRGADLLHGTAAQIYLQQLLMLPTPVYAHLPVALGNHGNKLSKQTFAPPLRDAEPVPQLLAAWAFLGQAPPPARPASPQDFWRNVIGTWNLAAVPRKDRQPSQPAYA